MKNFAPAIGAAVLVAAAVFVFVYESKTPSVPASPEGGSGPIAPQVAGDSDSTSPATPMPPIVPLASPGNGKGQGADQVAPGLGDLVGRIETKVKADPSNVSNRILLAQTYGEIGRLDEGIAEVRKLYNEKLDTGRVDMVLASLLIKSGTPSALSEAETLLGKALKRDGAQAGFVQLYKGRLLMAQGKADAAVKTWNNAMEKLSASDPARTQIESELALRRK